MSFPDRISECPGPPFYLSRNLITTPCNPDKRINGPGLKPAFAPMTRETGMEADESVRTPPHPARRGHARLRCAVLMLREGRRRSSHPATPCPIASPRRTGRRPGTSAPMPSIADRLVSNADRPVPGGRGADPGGNCYPRSRPDNPGYRNRRYPSERGFLSGDDVDPAGRFVKRHAWTLLFTGKAKTFFPRSGSSYPSPPALMCSFFGSGDG